MAEKFVQLELGRMRPKVDEADDRIAELIFWLSGKGWRKASEIKDALGWDDRTVRALASESEGRILSGQKGYRLTREAGADEIERSVRCLRAQARKMIARSLQIGRVWRSFSSNL